MSNTRLSKMKKNRHQNNQGSVRYYESPLKFFEKRSLRKCTSILDNFMNNRERRLTRGMLQKLNKQNTTDRPSRESSSRNSVIVINDSDNEVSNRDREREDASLSVIECSPKLSSPPQRKSRKESRSSLGRENRSSIIIMDSSDVYASSAQELDGENIAPLQGEDDVIELWSCLKNPSEADKDKRDAEYNRDITNKKLNFVIDTRPNLKYLDYLRTDARPVQKKQKLCYNSDKATLPLNESTTQRIQKHSNKNQKKRLRESESDTNSNGTQSNTESNGRKRKKLKSNKTSSTSNSKHRLREIIVDGCNVAMAHTNGQVFSEKGIQLVVDYFKLKGHVVKVFLPQHIRKKGSLYLEELYKEGTVVFTPSRYIAGRKITPYDDRYILDYATTCGGIVISSDQYRDLYWEKPKWRDTILNRLLTPTFVGDYIMFPEDPLGQSGPDLDTFLRH